MSMWICEKCGEVVSDNEIGNHKELMGECWGSPAYETVMDGCHCGGDYAPAKECCHCGQYFQSKTSSDLCPECEKNLEAMESMLEEAFIEGQNVKVMIECEENGKKIFKNILSKDYLEYSE